ncbi:MAG TPA: hypothetical protein VFF65_12695 [Phycisphaerales bacterium]|nr:hypothetical protein [Phycisphaerales bacterium]
MPNTHTPRRARRASILVATVVGLTVLLLVVSTIVLAGGRESELAAMRIQEARTVYAADAGANMALREVRRALDLDADGAIGTISNDNNAANDPAIGGVATGERVRVTPSGANLYTVAARSGTPARSYTLTLVPGAAAAHSDGFEGYTTGAALTGAGAGGWAPWDNAAGAVGYCSNTFSRTGVKSQEVRNTTDSVRLYTQTSGQWLYTAWQYIPSTATGTDHYFILLNTYSAGGAKNWSTQVRFQLSNNTVYDNMMGGVTGSVRTLVRDQWVPIAVAINLDLGTQTVSYNNQTLFTGSWNRRGGPRRLQAVDLYGSSASRVYYDDISLTAVGGGGSGATVTMVESP